MAPNQKYTLVEPADQCLEDKLADQIWGKRTEIVACILIMIVTIPVLGVMAIWMVHQLSTMGV